MDASRYLKLKMEAQGQYIRKNTFMDAGLRTEYISQQAAALTPVAAQKINRDCCNNEIRIGVSSCCKYAVDTQSPPGLQVPCCPFPYTSTTYLSPCKVQPYCATPAQQKEAWSRMTNFQYGECCSTAVRYIGPT